MKLEMCRCESSKCNEDAPPQPNYLFISLIKLGEPLDNSPAPIEASSVRADQRIDPCESTDWYKEIEIPLETVKEVEKIIRSISSSKFLMSKYLGIDEHEIFTSSVPIVIQEHTDSLVEKEREYSLVEINAGLADETTYYMFSPEESAEYPTYITSVTVGKKDKRVKDISFGYMFDGNLSSFARLFNIEKRAKNTNRYVFNEWSWSRSKQNIKKPTGHFSWIINEKIIRKNDQENIELPTGYIEVAPSSGYYRGLDELLLDFFQDDNVSEELQKYDKNEIFSLACEVIGSGETIIFTEKNPQNSSRRDIFFILPNDEKDSSSYACFVSEDEEGLFCRVELGLINGFDLSTYKTSYDLVRSYTDKSKWEFRRWGDPSYPKLNVPYPRDRFVWIRKGKK